MAMNFQIFKFSNLQIFKSLGTAQSKNHADLLAESSYQVVVWPRKNWQD
jgi:hypothetical protein